MQSADRPRARADESALEPAPVDPIVDEPAIDHLVARSQLEVLVKQVPVAVIATLLIAGVLALALFTEGVARDTLLLWYSSIAAAGAGRVVFAVWCRRRRASDDETRRRLWIYTGLAAGSGAGWGAAALLYMDPGHPTLFMLCVLALGGTASGAIGSLISYPPALYAFLSLTLVPAAVRSAAYGGVVGWAVAFMTAPYLFAAFSFGRVAHRTMLEAIRLRFKNESLVQQLTEQRDRATAAHERAADAVQAKSQFLAAASHDLRQPVHAMSLFVGALRPHGGRSGELAFIADRFETLVLALKGLLDGLLDISRLDAGIVAPRPVAVPLQPIMEKVAAELAGPAAQKGLELRVAPCSSWGKTDPEMLERILRNLVANAIRYTSSGKVLIGCRRGRSLRLCVYDTGVGIPAHLTEEVFLEFRQLENPERDRDKGLGLGLAIVRRLADLLDHPLEVRSRPGVGSCFSAAIEPAAPPALLTAAPAEAPLPALPGSTVLIVDDDVLGRDALRSLLSSWGCRVLAASALEEAAALAASAPRLDAILVDYRLRQHVTGYDVLVAIERALGRQVPAAIVTGDTAPERLREAEQTGYPLLHKPVTPALLHATLGGLLPAGSHEPLGGGGLRRAGAVVDAER